MKWTNIIHIYGYLYIQIYIDQLRIIRIEIIFWNYFFCFTLSYALYSVARIVGIEQHKINDKNNLNILKQLKQKKKILSE
jgi:hypothetical protein